MTGRPTREAYLAIAYVLRTGCAPSVAAAHYKVSVRTVQRGVAAAHASHPVGQPVAAVPRE